ncbi:hypothetical protein Patl1_26945 [Pistacia atlantica]|uniref:Uncharacterized protein n=1 Tax=Pistacia atlantica TaxID=434234 RepID=A0ACC1B0V4_9ROSI|nr:hypothetical protein Patl1_26945 [Pistacia atlantica]
MGPRKYFRDPPKHKIFIKKFLYLLKTLRIHPQSQSVFLFIKV